MAVKIGHASIDENGKAQNGSAGDQTGREVCTRDWYNKPWTSVIRPKSATVAEKIATAMEQACANNNIGYDQSQRTTLFAQAKANSWNLSKITVRCETDCSALVAVVVNCAGIPVSKDIYTGNELQALKATDKFNIYTSADYISNDNKLKRGDILLGKGHTAVVLSDGASQKPITEVAREVIAGKWGNGAIRKSKLRAAGYSYTAVQLEVSRILKGTKSIEEIAREVIAGKWGNGTARKQKLIQAGYDYNEVQKMVNKLS